MTPAEEDALFDKWVDWFERINNDITYLHRDRQVWRELMEMLSNNQEIPESWWIREWLTQISVKGLALGIRRQADTRNDVVSLVRLLREIQSNPNVISRDRFMAICNSSGEDAYLQFRLDKNYDEWSAGGSEIDPGLVQKRLDTLHSAAEKVTIYVNKRLAHDDEGDPNVGFTFGELDVALDSIGNLLTDLYLLLKCAGLASPNPTIVNPWRRAFVVPWESPDVVARWQAIQRFMHETADNSEE
jgi:hypothetical protein